MQEDHVGLLVGIDGKVDEVREKLHNIEIVQTRMESDLKYHIRRTDILEEKVMDIDEKVKPVESVKHLGTGIVKFLGFIGALAAAAAGIIRYLNK